MHPQLIDLDLGWPRLTTKKVFKSFDPNTNWMRMNERMKVESSTAEGREKYIVLGWEWMKEGKLKVARRNEEENKLSWDENEWKKESWV